MYGSQTSLSSQFCGWFWSTFWYLFNVIGKSEAAQCCPFYTYLCLFFFACLSVGFFFSIIIIKISPHEMSGCLTLFVSCLKCSDHILSTIFGHVLLARNFPSNMQLLLPLFSCFGFLWGAVSWCWVFFGFFSLHICQHLFHDFILIILLPRPQLT